MKGGATAGRNGMALTNGSRYSQERNGVREGLKMAGALA